MTMWNRKWQWNSQYPKKKEENKLVEMKKNGATANISRSVQNVLRQEINNYSSIFVSTVITEDIRNIKFTSNEI
jgi:hypothetical protein